MRIRLLHLTTADISLELLLGPQLTAYSDAGYEVIGVSAPGPFVEAVEARGARHVALRHATRAMDPARDLQALGELVRLFRQLRPTIVHTHNPKPGVYGRVAARLAGVPVIINTVHGLYATEDDSPTRRAAVYSLERLASCASQAELVQNVEDLAVLRRLLRVPASKLVLLGNGVDLDRFTGNQRDDRRSRVRRDLGLPPDAVVVGAVGRLVAEKGYGELLSAWSELSQQDPQAALIVVGPHDPQKADALDDDLMRAAEGAGVRFLGMRHDIEDLYTAMDVYVLASYREGFPRSAMEAAATGLPIIATDIRGCRQVVTDGVNGLLVDPGDANALQRAIAALIQDPERRAEMGRASAERAKREFDQRSVISTTLSTYERLLVAAGVSPP